MEIQAVIFDLNGTVLSDEDEYATAFRRVLKSLGKKVDKNFPHTKGIGVDENWPILISKYKIKTKKTIEELAQETQNEYIKLLSKVEVNKGFFDFVESLRQEKIKTALATSNSWLIVECVFDEFELESCFDVVTTKEEVAFNKPSPEIFTITADKLAVIPENCLVVEDSAAGIEAAYAAGMKTAGVYRDKKHKGELGNADILVKDFQQLEDKLVGELFDN
ncbi:MAG: HAD family phosphatase [Candidatus Woesebacteria bacterium]|jgi:HAD superfamily hydrolase (TIGR01509 family)